MYERREAGAFISLTMLPKWCIVQLQVWRRFDEDCAIAQSWQRLTDGKSIQLHDKTLIEHELYEMEIKKKYPDISHTDAHSIAQSKYNYRDEVTAYYDNLSKRKKK